MELLPSTPVVCDITDIVHVTCWVKTQLVYIFIELHFYNLLLTLWQWNGHEVIWLNILAAN